MLWILQAEQQLNLQLSLAILVCHSSYKMTSGAGCPEISSGDCLELHL